MSTTVDDRIVSMQFDNAHFEKNVGTTLSTLEKLKQSLNLTGAAKGLEGINDSVKKVNVSILTDGIQKVQASFSALEVMGVTALSNITNSAVNAGKRIASALTIEPVKTGFSEYELKMDSVKTIMASTGKSVETVNKYLEELNEYSDQTIYSFADMTQNIGKFTNAGVKLEDAVLAIKGISNEAALSGANANEASRAMYNFAQALSVGYIQRIDWKSIELANMATVEFKEQLLNAAIAAGTVKKSADGMYATLAHPDKVYNASAMFTETLDDQWLTTEVLIDTLKDYSDATTDIGERAFAAAQDVTKLSQMFDILKETAQSGWAKTWELVFGDINKAKAVFTPLTKFLSSIIEGMDDFRNNLLAGALDSPLGVLIKQVSPLTETIETVTEAVKDYEEVVNRVLGGEFGNGQARWDKLTEQGYDWAHVQNLVNEKMGDSTRHATKYKEAQNEVTKTQTRTIEQLAKMSDAQLKEAGVTEEQIKAIRELEKEADKAGVTIDEFINKFKDKKYGRTLLIESFKNAGQGLVAVLTSIKDAWVEVFPPMTSMQLYNIIYGLNQFSQHLKVSDTTAGKLKRTLKGVFALLDIALTIIGGPIKIALKVVSTLLGMFNLNWLDATAAMGDAIVAARDWIDANNPITKILKYIVEAIKDGIPAIQKWADENDIYNKTIGKVTPLLKNASTAIKNWVENNVDFAKGLKTVISFIKNTASAIGDWLVGIKDAENIPKYIITGLIKGLTGGATDVINAIVDLGIKLITAIRNVLGIHSPSKEFMLIGKYIIEGLRDGFSENSYMVIDAFKDFFYNCIDFIRELDLGTILAGGILVGGLLVVKQVSDTVTSINKTMSMVVAPLKGVGDMLTGIGQSFKGVASVLRAQAIQSMAISIGILAASVIALAAVDPKRLLSAMGAIIVLSGIIATLSFIAGTADKTVDFGKSSLSILAMAGALLVMASAVYVLAKVVEGGYIVGSLMALGIIIAYLVILMSSVGKFVDGDAMKNIDKAGLMIIKMSIAMVLMIGVIKLASKLEPGAIAKGISVVGALTILFGVIIAVSQLAGKHASEAGSMLLKMSFAMIVMIGVIKLASKLDAFEIVKGIFVIGMVEMLFILTIAVSKLAGEHGSKAGSMILKMAIAFVVMAGVIKLISKLNNDEIARGITVIAAMEILFIAVIAVSKLAGEHASKAGSMLFKMSAALLILAGVMFILSLIKPDGLARAVGAISVLEALFIGLIAASAIAKDSEGMIKVLTRMIIVISILVLSLIALTLLRPDKLASSVKALTTVMLSFAGLMIATKFMGDIKSVGTTLLALVGVVTLLAAILSIMSKFANAESALTSAKALCMLLGTMAAALLPLTVVGLAGPAALIGIATLAALILGIGGLIAGIGYLVTEFPQLQDFINTGMPLLEQLCTGIGKCFGNLIGGALEGISSGLPGIADNLSSFMKKLSVFVEGAKGITPESMEGVKALAEVLLILTAAQFLEGIASWLTGGSSLAAFGAELIPFGVSLAMFSAVTKYVDAEAVARTAEASKKLAELNNILPGIGGMLQKLTGTKSLAAFGATLIPFGTGLLGYAIAVRLLTEDDVEKIKTSANAAKHLAKLQDSINPIGGIADKIFGSSSLKDFGTTLKPFGKGLVAYAKSVRELTEDDLLKIETSAKAAGHLAKLQDSIDPIGGIADKLFGSSSLKDFGKTLKPFGTGLVDYAKSVKDISEEDIKHIKNTVTAAEALAKLSDSIEPIGGLITFFVGANDLDSFGGCIEAFGISLSEYSESIGTVSIDNINASVDAVLRLCELQDLASDRLYVVAGNINAFGEELSKFYDETCDINIGSLQSVATATTLIVNAINHMCDIKNEAVDKFKSAISKLLGAKGSLTKLGEFNTSDLSKVVTNIGKVGKMFSALSIANVSGVKTFVQTLKDLSNIDANGISKSLGDMASSMKKFATKIINSLNEGFTGGADKTKEALNNIKISLNSFLLTGIFYKLQFYSFGKNVVMGFVNGISENTYKAEAKARAMAAKAAAAAKAALNEHSPSKVFHEIGSFAGLGFVNGLDAYQSSAYSSGAEVATYAKKGLSEAINRVANYIDGDMDMQPTIRPVLDLSDVSNGVGAIDGMFGGINPSVKALSNIGTISTMMNRNQNGTNNSEVISAINDLGKRLGTPSSNTYNINGVTYDDGSNVKEAVETLIRAAIVERRR